MRRRRGNGWRMRGCCEEQTWRSHSSRGVMEGGDEGGDGERGGRVHRACQDSLNALLVFCSASGSVLYF